MVLGVITAIVSVQWMVSKSEVEEIRSFKNNPDRNEVFFRKRPSIKLLNLICSIGILFGLAILFITPLAQLSLAEKSKEYDDWFYAMYYADEDVEELFRGRIGEISRGRIQWRYTFEGCDFGFVSNPDLAEEGDYVLVRVINSNGAFGTFIAYWYPPIVGAVLALISLVLAGISFSLFLKGKNYEKNCVLT